MKKRIAKNLRSADNAAGGVDSNRRYIDCTAENLRVEGGEDGKPLKIAGYAVLFNQRSRPLKTRAGSFVEIIKPGAFKRTLADPSSEAMFLRNHVPDQCMARRSADTLKLWEDEKGLAFECFPAATTLTANTVEDIRHKNIRGISIGFDDPPPGGDKWERIDGVNVRTITDAPLREISAVLRPAYAGTTLSVRSEEQHVAELEKPAVDPAAAAKMRELQMRHRRAEVA